MTSQRRKIVRKGKADAGQRPGRAPQEYGDRSESLARLCSDGYWEMNEEFRFPCSEGHSTAHSLFADGVNKHPWEIGAWRDITTRKRAEQVLSLEHTVTRCLADAESASEALSAAIQAICCQPPPTPTGRCLVDTGRFQESQTHLLVRIFSSCSPPR